MKLVYNDFIILEEVTNVSKSGIILSSESNDKMKFKVISFDEKSEYLEKINIEIDDIVYVFFSDVHEIMIDSQKRFFTKFNKIIGKE